jgi:hypothetical protein
LPLGQHCLQWPFVYYEVAQTAGFEPWKVPESPGSWPTEELEATFGFAISNNNNDDNINDKDNVDGTQG